MTYFIISFWKQNDISNIGLHEEFHRKLKVTNVVHGVCAIM